MGDAEQESQKVNEKSKRKKQVQKSIF